MVSSLQLQRRARASALRRVWDVRRLAMSSGSARFFVFWKNAVVFDVAATAPGRGLDVRIGFASDAASALSL